MTVMMMIEKDKNEKDQVKEENRGHSFAIAFAIGTRDEAATPVGVTLTRCGWIIATMQVLS